MADRISKVVAETEYIGTHKDRLSKISAQVEHTGIGRIISKAVIMVEYEQLPTPDVSSYYYMMQEG